MHDAHAGVVHADGASAEPHLAREAVGASVLETDLPRSLHIHDDRGYTRVGLSAGLGVWVRRRRRFATP
jgi:hypothetical protein